MFCQNRPEPGLFTLVDLAQVDLQAATACKSADSTGFYVLDV